MMLKQTLSFTQVLASTLKLNNIRLVHVSVPFAVSEHFRENSSQKLSGKKSSEAGESKGFDLKNLSKLGLAKDDWSWPKYNRIIYPPRSADDNRGPVTPFVHHMRTYIKYSPKKLWYPAVMVRPLLLICTVGLAPI